MILTHTQINEVHAADEVVATRPRSLEECIADARRRFDTAGPGDPILALESWLIRLEGMIAKQKEQP